MKHSIFTIIIVLLLVSCNEKHPKNKTEKQGSSKIGIPTTTTANIGIDSPLLHEMTMKITNQEYPNIHSVLIAKNGKLCYEHYFKGPDQIFGRDIGTIQYSDSTLHDVRSVTKSIVSACIGIAIEKGHLKDVDQKISDFFPEMDTVFKEGKSNWTIQHFLTMTTGLDWNEEVPYDNPENDEVQMTGSENPISYVFSQPLVTVPGEKFNYSGGATQVLAKIIERASKTPIDQFVEVSI